MLLELRQGEHESGGRRNAPVPFALAVEGFLAEPMMVLEHVAVEEQELEEVDGSFRGEQLPAQTEGIRVPGSRGLSLDRVGEVVDEPHPFEKSDGVHPVKAHLRFSGRVGEIDHLHAGSLDGVAGIDELCCRQAGVDRADGARHELDGGLDLRPVESQTQEFIGKEDHPEDLFDIAFRASPGIDRGQQKVGFAEFEAADGSVAGRIELLEDLRRPAVGKVRSGFGPFAR